MAGPKLRTLMLNFIRLVPRRKENCRLSDVSIRWATQPVLVNIVTIFENTVNFSNVTLRSQCALIREKNHLHFCGRHRRYLPEQGRVAMPKPSRSPFPGGPIFNWMQKSNLVLKLDASGRSSRVHFFLRLLSWSRIFFSLRLPGSRTEGARGSIALS